MSKVGTALTVIAVGLALVMCVPKCGHKKSKTYSAEREKIQLPEGEYLVNRFTPEDSYCYTAYPYEYEDSGQMKMSGGLDWHGGFRLTYSHGPYTPGYAVFRLGREYEKLMFVLGYENFESGAGGNGSYTEPSIFTVTADGRKILDEVVYPYGIPHRFTLDIKGVDELKFQIVSGSGRICVAEATLWKKGETPVETGNLIVGEPEAKMLVKDIRPYFQSRQFENVSPDDITSIKVNGRPYGYGFAVDMKQALVGANEGWAYFNLRKQYSTLSFVLGPLDEDGSSTGSGWISVKADGRIIYENELSYDDIAKAVVLDITGCEMLSFHSEQASGSLRGGIAEMTVYPEGEGPEPGAGYSVEDGVPADDDLSSVEFASTVDPRLKELPDVCKLISNIPPYTADAQATRQIYDGTSDHITFSMGGQRFSEGIVLYKKASLLDNRTSAFAVFDLGNEFDYMTFTAGYIGKSWTMNNDLLRVYADDRLVLETPLIATAPNQKYTVPLGKCRKLRFENRGSGNLDVAAYGIGDIVVYRGDPVPNDLFPRPVPECPYTVDLIDLGAPYIHYVSPMGDHKDEIFYDGSTRRRYFEIDGKRIYKGFLLQTSVHFSLDYGALSGTDGAGASVLGGAAVGAAFVPAGIAVGGAVVGSTLIGAAAFLMLAAGGEAMENSCAAFNTYGQYNSVTFTVACYKPYISADDYRETLLIGADHEVVAELSLYETMEPQTVTVPIDGCGQLMFWLSNTDNWSGQFLFYDIRLTKDRLPLNIPEAVRPQDRETGHNDDDTQAGRQEQ